MKLFNFNTVLICFICVAFQSCLDLEPKDKLADTNIWQTAEQYKLFANQFYGWLRDFSSVTSDGPHSDYRSDLIAGSTPNIYSNGTNTIPSTDGNYTTSYDRIRQVNILLQKAELYAMPADINTSVGEAKFFRAYLYFDLLQLYGDAIIVKNPLDIDAPELQQAQNPRGEVVDFIIQDLNDAIILLPDFKTLSASDNGRLSKEAAQAFLSRVALYEGTWQKFRENDVERSQYLLTVAVNAAEKVMNGGAFSLFKPADLGIFSYKYMFILENEKSNPANIAKSGNTEYILTRRHDEIVRPIGGNLTQSLMGKTIYFTRKLANLYLTQKGIPINPTNSDLYKTMTSEYENRDNRMQNTMMIAGRPYWSNSKGRSSWKEDETDLKLAFYQSFDPKMNSGYFCQKWCTERQVTSGYEGYDFPVIRYAEVLLNYAEAFYELYESEGKEKDQEVTDALNISLNLVRQRVNSTMPSLTVEFATENGLDMREEIRRERTVEFVHEGFRIDDLKRWNKATNEMKGDMLGVKYIGTEFGDTWTNMTRKTNAEGCIIMETARGWSEKNYLYPLPADQMRLNPNLKQNPGWDK